MQVDFQKRPLFPLATVEDVEAVLDLASALVEGGVPTLEVAFRSELAGEAISRLAESGPKILVGAGTVRTVDQVAEAVEAGAQFVVSPGLNARVVEACGERGVPAIPGVDSTLGIEQAVELGLSVLKFFPADVAGGIRWLRAMAGPYADLEFVPTGGINLDNLASYFSLPNVVAVGGSFLAPAAAIRERRFAEVTAACRAAVDVVQVVRGSGGEAK
ncbi:MAG: bifunctional 4-hydroxy-2-oxoglutarate aldolase/2-dehydro-3-deoxy-phosphogluconate aldolase [Promethearchaeota archaeon]